MKQITTPCVTPSVNKSMDSKSGPAPELIVAVVAPVVADSTERLAESLQAPKDQPRKLSPALSKSTAVEAVVPSTPAPPPRVIVY